MAKEYKFMFDRRFDEPDEKEPEVEDVSKKSVDGLPSISQLLDSINEQIQDIPDPDVGDNGSAEQTESEIERQIERNFPQLTETPDSETKENNDFASEEDMPAVLSVDDLDIPEEKDEPTFSAEELESARAQALSEGRMNGLAEGRDAAWKEAMASIEKQNSDTLTTIAASLNKAMTTLEKSAENAFSTAVEIAVAVCKKAVPSLCETNALEEVRLLLEKNLHFLKDEPKISLRLNPSLADPIKPVVTDLVKKEAYAGRIAVVRDENVPVGDCRVEWKNGGLEKNLQEVLNHTEELINLYTHTSPADKPPAALNGEEKHG